MATRLHLRDTRNTRGAGTPGTLPLDMNPTAGGASDSARTSTVAGGASEVQIKDFNGVLPVEWVSQRVAAEVTLSGSISVNLYIRESLAAVNAAVRVKLFKVTSGGSDVLTQFASGETDVELPIEPSTAATAFTVAIPTPITLAVDERIVLHVFAIPAPATTFGDGTVTLYYDAASDHGFSWIEFTEALTFKANGATLYLRSTATNAIGNFFDLITTASSTTFVTGVVNTVAGGTDIPWTRTADGTSLEWISGRIRKGFRIEDPQIASQFVFSLNVWALESGAPANATIRYRVYRYRAGQETLIAMKTHTAELETSASTATIIQALGPDVTQVDVLPDDRLILRCFLTNVGTMGGARTATLNYDHNVANANGRSFLTLWDSLEFKAEGEPDDPATIPDGQSTLGIGN